MPESTLRPTDKIIFAWLNKLNDYGRGMTPWEINFVHQMRTLMLEGRYHAMTDKQINTIERICAERTTL